MSDYWDEKVNLRLQKFTSTRRRRWSIFSKREKPSKQKSGYMGRDIFSIFFVQIDAPIVLQLWLKAFSLCRTNEVTPVKNVLFSADFGKFFQNLILEQNVLNESCLE